MFDGSLFLPWTAAERQPSHHFNLFKLIPEQLWSSQGVKMTSVEEETLQEEPEDSDPGPFLKMVWILSELVVQFQRNLFVAPGS